MPRHPFLPRLTPLVLLFFLAAQILSPAPAGAFFFGGVSIKDEKEMGRKVDAAVRSRLAVVDDPEVRLYAEDVLRRLVKAIPPQPFEFKTTVLLHNALNAFAVPGGYVYVFTGLIMHLPSESALAGVLAHELAHVTQRHVASRLERAQFVTLGTLLLAVAGVAAGMAAGGGNSGAVAAGVLGAGQSAMLNYSRMDETEADQIGLQYHVAAGYPPLGMVDGFKVLRKQNWLRGTSVPTYLSTHPDIGERITGLTARIEGMPAAIRSRKGDNRRFLRVQALLWARHGDPDAALRRFTGHGGLNAMGRGIVLARRNRVADAAAAFDAALAAAPDDPLVLREAGIFHFRKGDMARAEQLLQAALRRDPRDYMAAFFKARMLDETGRQAQAAPFYKDVLRQVPQDAEVHEAYARSLGKAGDEGGAYIHMTYSAMYANNRKMAERYLKQARALAARSGHAADLRRLENAYKERKELWEKS